MKFARQLIACLSMAFANALARTASPVAKVVELLSQMQAKITSEGDEAKKVYEEYQEWCEDQARKLAFEIKTEKGEVNQLGATIEDAQAIQTTLKSKVEKLGGAISSAEKELEEATALRKKEATDFQAESKELSDAISLLGKAIHVLQQSLGSSGASMVQLRGASSLTQALGAIIKASMLSTSDAKRITSLISRLDDSDSEFGAPAAAAYEGHSSSLIETLERMKVKAKEQLAKLQKEESEALHNFEMLKQSLEDELDHGKQDMSKTKSGLATSREEQATAEGELEDTTQELSADKTSKKDLEAECMEKARDYEAAAASREDELKALGEAKKAIMETTGGAEKATYGLSQTSFLELGHVSTSPASIRVPFAVVRRLREAAAQQQSAALTQLASRMATAVSLSTMQGSDPFQKVRKLISDLLAKLEQEAADDGTQKSFCDKELSESSAKKDKKDAEIEKLSTKIDQLASRSDKLKGQVATLQKELADIAKSQGDMDALRKEERASFVKNKKDLEDGLSGVKLALKVLRAYYGKADKSHDASGSSSSLIAMIEVCESDFSKGLSEAISTEEAAQKAYEEQTQDNKVDTAAKSKAVKFKTKTAAELDKTVTESKQDMSATQEELNAVLEYLEKLKGQCIAKPVPYEERAKARENEIASLKEGLAILEGEEALLQGSAHRSLRLASRRVASP